MDDEERVVEAVVRRRLGPDLWVGRDGGRCIGTIEGGNRFTRVDPDGARHCGHATLEDAQRAARTVLPDPRPPWYDRRSAALAVFWALSAAVIAVLWTAGALLVL